MNLPRYVVDDRRANRFLVNRAAMTDPAVLAAERRAVFDRSWLYVGHESELPEANFWRARDVGGRPVIFARDTDGAVTVLLNSCTHRGTTLCREPAGQSRFFRCFYHAWTFDTAGRLISLPGEDGYSETFDRDCYQLARPAAVESYRGFVFATWNPDADGLVDYLGEVREYLDLVSDQAAEGMEVLRGTHEYSVAANWKLLVENSMDGYHLLPTHHRYVEMVKAAGARFLGGAHSRGADLGGGHACAESIGGAAGVGRPFPTESGQRKWDDRRAELTNRFGAGWANRIYGSRNVLIFPNLMIIDLVGGIVVRVIDPLAADRIAVTAWELAPVGEDPELRAARLDNFLTFWGPGGMATPDDVEALECCQDGFRAYPSVEWSDISRGLGKDRCSAVDELQMRAFWRRWNELMTGEIPIPEPTTCSAAFLAQPEERADAIHGG